MERIQLMHQSFVTTASPLSPPVYAKSFEVLQDICQTDTFFFAGQNGNLPDRKNSRVGVGLSTDFNHQFAKILVLMYSESKRK